MKQSIVESIEYVKSTGWSERSIKQGLKHPLLRYSFIHLSVEVKIIKQDWNFGYGVINSYICEVKDPLKQGLKHYICNNKIKSVISWSERSIKTRIETRQLLVSIWYWPRKDPLKQGLKHRMNTSNKRRWLKWKIH